MVVHAALTEAIFHRKYVLATASRKNGLIFNNEEKESKKARKQERKKERKKETKKGKKKDMKETVEMVRNKEK